MSLTFDLQPLRFTITPRHAASLTPNLLRGAFGSALKQLSPADYARFFAPSAIPGHGPSGLADPPRPFVFRLADAHHIGIHVFDTSPSAAELFIRAMRHVDAFEIDSVEQCELVRLPLESALPAVDKLRVRFLTPTEVKGADRPDFGILMARVRDRVSTLRALYGAGPLDLDFKAFGDRAGRVTLTRCEIMDVEAERVSRRTGQRHSLGGFVGVAEYAGSLGEFIPYLEAARWTGVGRQTVWGKGEIAYETL